MQSNHIVNHTAVTKVKSVEKTLIRMLLNRYEQFGVVGRPVNDSKIQVVVAYGLQLFQILDLDENKQILRTNCWSMYQWQDSLLTWNHSEYGDIRSVRIFPSYIWTPDIKLYNFADERLKEHREARVVIQNDGSVLWIPQALFKSTCEVEITYFPFDTQVCMLEFGSWTYDKTQMDIIWWTSSDEGAQMSPFVDFSDYVPSNEWRTDGELERDVTPLERKLQIRSVKRYRRRNQTVGNQTLNREYPVLCYLVRLRRNPSFYVFMLVIPCVLLSSLTLVVFWLPPESPAKMMLGMNIFVAFFILLLLLAESTPSAVRNFPLIGVFFCLNMIMITLSTFLATLVIHLYFRGDRNGSVPAFLRRMVIEGIGRLVYVRQRIPLPDVKKPVAPNSPRGISVKGRSKPNIPEHVGNKFFLNYTPTAEDSRVGYYGTNNRLRPGFIPGSCPQMYGGGPLLPQIGKMMGPTYPSYFDTVTCSCMGSRDGCKQPTAVNEPVAPQRPLKTNHPGLVPTQGKAQTGESDDSPDLLESTVTLERDVREVKRYVKMFVNRQKEIHRKSLIAMEWRTLALVLDRLFFFLYITTIGIAVLVSVPRSTEPVLKAEFLHSEE
ncbi:neuronal acetylcholine receptor subunit alpha-4 [Clonorchis sinensis]|uniref:Neuronal acetylcholine receptor subunit alpha-4 n=1 Tax=Clonorchis sinensis TaxID=79923 RepID=G7YFG9_CLOSI|nr:neuronal acetylcholine receptor subunit alpha-4 [Clonorchis sinensis]